MSIIQELQEAAVKVRKAKQEAKELADRSLSAALKEFLKQYPEIQTIMWCQYTPYFNDGDACVFSVGDIHFCTSVYEEYEWEPEDGFSFWRATFDPEEWAATADQLNISPETIMACYHFNDALTAFEDEMQDIFGDHVLVIVTSDGIAINEFSHD